MTEIYYNKNEYKKFKQIIEKYCGIKIDEDKFKSTIEMLIKEFQYKNINELIENITSINSDSIKQKIAEKLLVYETSFFRNPKQFTALKQILFELAESKKNNEKINIWSTCCCSGEEIYSIAMVCYEIFGDDIKNKCELLGTDISTKMLDKAKAGIFTKKSFKNIDDYYYKKYFIPSKKSFQLKDKIIHTVNFEYQNLNKYNYPCPEYNKWDIIFCRNVFIYFDQKLIKNLTDMFYSILNNNGYLFLGDSENLINISHKFNIAWFNEAFVYQKDISNKNTSLQYKLESLKQLNKKMNNCGDMEIPKRVKKDKIIPVKNPLKKIFLNALKNYSKNKKVEAWNIIKAHLKKDYYGIHYIAALINADEGKLAEAIKHCNISIKNETLFERSHYLLAIIYYRLNELDKSILEFEKTIYINKNFIMSYFYLGEIYIKIKDFKKGNTYLNKGLEILKSSSFSYSKNMPHSNDGFTFKTLYNLFEINLDKCKKHMKEMHI